jgi:PAS domain S-box-containing protein
MDILPDSDAIVAPLPLVASQTLEAPRRFEFEAGNLLKALPTAVYTTDAAGRITFYNEAAAALWGCRPELEKSEWCGSWRLYWPDGRLMRHDECPMAIALKEKRAIRGAEIVAARPDGTCVPLLAYPTPLFDVLGVLLGGVNTLVDITDRIEAERSAQRLAAIVESTDDVIMSHDMNGIVSTCNRAGERLYGYSAEELVGMPVEILVPPDRRHEETLILERVRRGERIKDYETICRRKGGGVTDVLLTVLPIKNAQGSVVGVSRIAHDITRRKDAERSVQRLAAIVESSDDAIASKDLNGIINTWNAAAERLFGYTAEEVIGKPVTILIPADRQDEEPKILERLRRGDRVDHYETVRQRRDGSLVEVSLTVSPIKDADGRVIGASKIARDITEHKRAEEKQHLLLREMNHRIKNLFALVGALITLSARSAGSPGDLAQSVHDRLAALAHAHDLTLPDLTEGREKSSQTTTLQSLIEIIVAPYLAQDAASVSVTGPDVPIGRKAAMGIALLLNELATNAAKYGALSSESGNVDVSWRVSKNDLLLTWRERGGPPVNGVPGNEGFGSLLVRLTVTGQLGGKVCQDWNRSGLSVTLSAPLERLMH